MVRLTLLAVSHAYFINDARAFLFLYSVYVLLNVRSCLVNLVHISARVMTVN